MALKGLRSRSSFWFLILPLSSFLGSCVQSAALIPKVPSRAIFFSSDVKPILEDRCLACHSSLATYENVKTDIASILSRIAARKMPPSGNGLSAEEFGLIQGWSDQGTPN